MYKCYKLGVKYNTATILGAENRDVINKRNIINKSNISKFDMILNLNRNETDYYKNILVTKTENISFQTFSKFSQNQFDKYFFVSTPF